MALACRFGWQGRVSRQVFAVHAVQQVKGSEQVWQDVGGGSRAFESGRGDSSCCEETSADSQMSCIPQHSRDLGWSKQFWTLFTSKNLGLAGYWPPDGQTGQLVDRVNIQYIPACQPSQLVFFFVFCPSTWKTQGMRNSWWWSHDDHDGQRIWLICHGICLEETVHFCLFSWWLFTDSTMVKSLLIHHLFFSPTTSSKSKVFKAW